MIFSLGSGSEEIGFPRAPAVGKPQVLSSAIMVANWDTWTENALNLNLSPQHFHLSHKRKPQSPS